MKTKKISKSNWKSHLRHLRRWLIMLCHPDQTKLFTIKLRFTMNPYMVLIGALNWRTSSPFYATTVWATCLNSSQVKRKGCLKVQLTKILVFLIMMPCHWWQQWIWPEMDIFTSKPILKFYRSSPPGKSLDFFKSWFLSKRRFTQYSWFSRKVYTFIA